MIAFLNNFVNNCNFTSKKYFFTDVERNRPERRAYSKLNQNSDDLNFGTKNDLLITNVENEKSRELKLKISKFVNKSDNNGNEMEYLQRKHVAINIATDSILDVEDEYSNSKNSIDPMTISDDDDDYGKTTL